MSEGVTFSLISEKCSHIKVNIFDKNKKNRSLE